MSDRSIFNQYAHTYDSIYAEKDYQTECNYIENTFQSFGAGRVKNLLDLGCGTGGHAIELAKRGFSVIGLDLSPEMIAIARQKAKNEKQANERLSFDVANIRDFQLPGRYDAAICMFAVMGYLTDNDALFAALKNIKRHLREDGLFICDFWYGPAVLSQKPEERLKIVPLPDNNRILRHAVPTLIDQSDVVNVHYHLFRLQGNVVQQEIEEDHKMRYFFKPELDFFLNQAGFRLLQFSKFLETNQQASRLTWNVSLVAQAEK